MAIRCGWNIHRDLAHRFCSIIMDRRSGYHRRNSEIMTYKRAKIETDGDVFYLHTGGKTSQYSTLWSACRGAVRFHRKWIVDKGRFDNGVRIALPDGGVRMGWIFGDNEVVKLDPIKGKRK